MTPAEFIEKAVAEVTAGLANANATGVTVGHISVAQPLNFAGCGRISKGGTVIRLNLEIPVAERDGELVVTEPAPGVASITVPVPVALTPKQTTIDG